MKIVDKGVLEPSYMDFTVPSAFAKSALYYLYQHGRFYCNKEYRIERNFLDMFLFIYVSNGSLAVKTKGKTYTAVKDNIVLLDCRAPHAYFCPSAASFLWFHFNGSSSSQYAQYLYEQQGAVFSEAHVPQLKSHFETILSCAQAIMVNEHYISQKISYILSKLAAPSSKILLNNPLSSAVQYIMGHYSEEIDLNQLAHVCSLSVSHFIRSFKAYTGYTPHEYLLSYRLRQAKQLLLTSSATIEEIAEKCGFNSASHFARAFRKTENISPTAFRRLEF